MSEHFEQPKYLFSLFAAIVTLWVLSSIGTFILFAFQEGDSIGEAITVLLLLLFIGGPTAFVFGGIVSFPMWWLCRRFYRLNRNIAAIIGALTGAIISIFVIFYFPGVYSMPAGATKEGLIILIIMAFFGALAGWNGYRVAWNGRRRKKALKA